MLRHRLKGCLPGVLLLAALAGVAHQTLHAAGRRGPVRLEGRALADADGPFLALGATLFWALWGEQHDPDRLDQNLAWLAGRGVDYVRILAMIGGESWEDRVVDPDAADYWRLVDRLLERLARHGLRAQVTLFAEADTMMPRASDRRAFALEWADLSSRHPDRIILLEVANEHWQNGVTDIDELRDLGARVARRTETLVALSAPLDGKVCDVYEGSEADLATIHYDRSREAWTSVRQPWEWRSRRLGCRDSLPVPVNNEPMGPQSSVEADDDPGRLVMSYLTTFLAGNAAYVLHAGAGVRGGGAADRALGRAADFAGTPRLDVALGAIAEARGYLPADLANWTPLEPDDRRHPFRGFDVQVEDGSAGAIYSATKGRRFVVAVLDGRRTVSATAVNAMTVEVHDPLEGVVGRHELDPGERLRLDGREAYILTGRTR